MSDGTSTARALARTEQAGTAGAAQGATTRLRGALAWARDRLASLASPTRRGWSFWLVTILLGVLLPAPVAVAVVVARVRGSGSGPRSTDRSPAADVALATARRVHPDPTMGVASPRPLSP